MHTQMLHENWTLRIKGEDEIIPATVPGSVYNDLLTAGKTENPYWRDNELVALRIMDNDFIYTTRFDTDDDILADDSILLKCEGLDTVCDIVLNGTKLGYADNQHRTWEFNVKDILKKNDNELTVLFYSPTKYIKAQQALIKVDGTPDAMEGFPHIRKAHCMFGWDWGPRLPDAGIWRNIMLVGIQTARISNVYITQHHSKDNVDLHCSVEHECMDAGVHIDYDIHIINPDGSITETYTNSAQDITIKNPQLWWPNGYGEQPLYTITVELKANGTIIDVWQKRIGLRTMTVRREKDEYGESFAHEVNGLQIFAMGADYIPEDNIFSAINPQRTQKLLEQCIAANFNSIRVWGGGYYPDDWFYDTCDELGLIVWQDMMFACAVYELTEDFEKNIRQELIDNIKRIRHHASLGLWCGNNEMEMFVDKWEWVSSHKQKADYIKMYEYIFPNILKEYDPNTFYWPASPSSGGSFDEPNDPNRGDVHYWDVWHGNKPFSDYRNFYFRYASEFGFQSFPCQKTVESFTLPEDRNIFSYVMEKHQRSNSANGKILNYMYQTHRYPTDFSTLLYASQMLQAEAIKYGVEHWRRHRGRCMGAIYWQLNDCWPVASWSSIDYFGRWKALHYYAKRFFAPILLSCCEEGTMTQEQNINAECQDLEKSIHLNVANETLQEQRVTVRWFLRKNTAEIQKSSEQTLNIPPLTSVWLDKVCFPEAHIRSDYVSYEAEQNGKIISSGSVLFCAPKHFEFLNPHIKVEQDGDKLIVSTKGYAKGVELLNENQDCILEDNYFDLSNEQRIVKVIGGTVDTVSIRSMYDIR
ncbi:MAG: glycoside hydrolase family 2 protein [Spirochaetales bacterium]